VEGLFQRSIGSLLRQLIRELFMDEGKNFDFTGYNRNLVFNARTLRKNMTPQEGKLWHLYLKNYPIKFYRQRIIDSYIVDFYCSEAKLIVEIDGSQHYTPEGLENDCIRTEILQQYGLAVIRFSNLDIDTNIYNVCDVIDKKVKERLRTKDPSVNAKH